MSEITPQVNTPVNPEPAKAPAPKAKRSSKPMTVAEVAKAIAKAKQTTPDVEAKKLRGYIRANFVTLSKEWPGLSKAKNGADGNRYPAMPAKLGRELIKRRTK